MEHQTNTQDPQPITIELEFLPEDTQNTNPATVGEIERDVVAALKKDNYIVRPIYTGTRSGIFPVEIIPTALNIANEIWAHRDVLDALSALCTIFGTVIPVAKHIFTANEKQAVRSNTPISPIKITTEIDGAPISIEAPDLDSAEGAMNLAKRFQTTHPTIAQNITPQSKVKITNRVPKTQQRRRR